MTPAGLDEGTWVFAVATVYFAAFVAAHGAIVMIGRRFERTAPREGRRRVRAARTVAFLHLGKAAWFVILAGVAADTVVTSTPELPVLEVIIVYGGLIGIVFGLKQASDWFVLARRARSASEELARVQVTSGWVVDEPVTQVRLPESILARILAGEALTGQDIDLVRTANGRDEP